MLLRFKRHKERRGFAVDRIFKGLSTNYFSKNGSHLFTTHKYLSAFYGDDRFCNMLVQWNDSIIAKLSSTMAGRLFPFYPSYMPLFDRAAVISKHDMYLLANGVEYECINCKSDIYVKWGSRNIRNFLCSRCISIHFMNRCNEFLYKGVIKRTYGEKFSKNVLDFFSIEKQHEQNTLKTVMSRRKKYLKLVVTKEEYKKIVGTYKSITNLLLD